MVLGGGVHKEEVTDERTTNEQIDFYRTVTWGRGRGQLTRPAGVEVF